MNKEKVLEKLKESTGLSESECSILNNILENHFLIGKNNKEKIITDIIEKLKVSEEKANELYNNSMTIIGNELKEKIKHPFKNQE